jgi:hypothetical protein
VPRAPRDPPDIARLGQQWEHVLTGVIVFGIAVGLACLLTLVLLLLMRD